MLVLFLTKLRVLLLYVKTFNKSIHHIDH